MEYYAGIDVSSESASVCVVDATGRIMREAKMASEPEVLIERGTAQLMRLGWFRPRQVLWRKDDQACTAMWRSGRASGECRIECLRHFKNPRFTVGRALRVR